MSQGRIAQRSVTKPSLMHAVNVMDGVGNLAKALKISSSCVSNWLYTTAKVTPEVADRIEAVCRNRKKIGLLSKPVLAEGILKENPPLGKKKCQQ